MNLPYKIQSSLMLGAFALTGLGALPTYAATDSTTTSVTITAGSLIIDSPVASVLSGITLTTANQNSTGSISAVKIEDLRGSLAGWSSNMTLSNFAGVTDSSKILLLGGQASPTTLTNKYLTITPSTITTVGGDSTGLTAYNSASQISSLSALTASGTSNAFSIATASSGRGAGTYTVDVGISIQIPAYGYYAPTGTSVSGQNYSSIATYQVS